MDVWLSVLQRSGACMIASALASLKLYTDQPGPQPEGALPTFVHVAAIAMRSQSAHDSFCMFYQAMQFCGLPVLSYTTSGTSSRYRSLCARSSPGHALKQGGALWP